jgi:enterobactin synthetase component D
VLPAAARWCAANLKRFAPATETASLQERLENRRREFDAGRQCAAEALRLAGAQHWSEEVGAGPAGEPLWPDGFVGSITHSRGLVAAAVASRHHASALGIDLEHVVAEERASRVSRIVLHACESRLKADGLDETTRFTLIFSAKEALFKCLYPVVLRRFGYRDAAVRRIDTTTGTFRIELITPLGAAFPRGHSFTGRYSARDGIVLTGFCLEADKPDGPAERPALRIVPVRHPDRR